MAAFKREVRSVLDDRALVALEGTQTVRQAAVVLTTYEVGAAPVMNGDALEGIFSERDILGKVVAQGLDPERTTVRDIMTREPQTIEAEAPLVRAYAKMVEGKFRHLPVTGDDGRVIAMLSMRDIPPEHRIMHQQWNEWTTNKGGVTLRP